MVKLFRIFCGRLEVIKDLEKFEKESEEGTGYIQCSDENGEPSFMRMFRKCCILSEKPSWTEVACASRNGYGKPLGRMPWNYSFASTSGKAADVLERIQDMKGALQITEQLEEWYYREAACNYKPDIATSSETTLEAK